ncbi:hypothetical protein ACWD4L_27115 [Streptomyces sp. NPDC002596]|uniref:hypothetical protein n=1 Tax=unclassified Streptomyces TaxID=2593676 RepID=UPI00224F6A63|nr:MULTISPECIES: hypothetical protein [unclassified Streptomyces]MCX4538692.1 hypothetical protein [Streptomyces sp. NBC_01669]WSA05495.1 hypothetical protein OHA79_49285 [Streptomyces sp. NBC_00841]
MVELPCDSPLRSAEVDEVRLRDGQILLLWSHSGTDTEKAVLVLKARGAGHREMRLPADSAEGRFQVHLQMDALATACTAQQWIWDLYIDPCTGEEPWRLGRHLDDITGKQGILGYQSQHAPGVVVEPYYTIKGNLSLRCIRLRVC